LVGPSAGRYMMMMMMMAGAITQAVQEVGFQAADPLLI
jgi:hypothetical protein